MASGSITRPPRRTRPDRADGQLPACGDGRFFRITTLQGGFYIPASSRAAHRLGKDLEAWVRTWPRCVRIVRDHERNARRPRAKNTLRLGSVDGAGQIAAASRRDDAQLRFPTALAVVARGNSQGVVLVSATPGRADYGIRMRGRLAAGKSGNIDGHRAGARFFISDCGASGDIMCFSMPARESSNLWSDTGAAAQDAEPVLCLMHPEDADGCGDASARRTPQSRAHPPPPATMSRAPPQLGRDVGGSLVGCAE